MIKFSRIYNYNGNEYKILIDRMWPRGISKDKIDLWYKDIAPSNEIIKEYHNSNNYDNFKKEYINELNNNSKFNEFINIIKNNNCILLYSSKRDKNNATVLKEYLEKLIN